MSTTAAICRLNTLRLARVHLEHQLDGEIATRYATRSEARRALAETNAEIRALEEALRKRPGCEYLFRRRKRR